MRDRYDVAIIGAGPVGLAAAGFLGLRGWSVGVFDQETSAYPLPRAGHVDSEVMRLLQILGCADEFAPKAVPLREAVFWDRHGEVLTRLPLLTGDRSGWFSDYLMYQPDFDDALLSTISRLADVEVHRGRQLIAIDDTSEPLRITLQSRDSEAQAGQSLTTISAGYLIGADGANSFVRSFIDSAWDDLGFEERWLVLDIRPFEADMELDLPVDAQLCDPARPTSLFRWLGREHVRLEFMLHTGEDSSVRDSEARCWSLAERWGLSPDNSSFSRRAVYTFQSRIAQQWRKENIILAGDAAHLMPPFLGQGMCSGIRDAANIAWKLDLVLRSQASPDLLDTYQSERSPHVLAFIQTSVAAGKIVCITDPVAADERDAALRALSNPPLEPPPPLHHGIEYISPSSEAGRFVGSVSWQGRVMYEGRTGLLLDIVGPGWMVLSRRRIDEDTIPLELRAIPVRPLQLSLAPVTGSTSAMDVDGDYDSWFAAIGCTYAVVRPDLYVYGVACSEVELAQLLHTLQWQLSAGPYDGH